MNSSEGVVYHGSPELLGEITPQNLHGDPNMPSGIFASPQRMMALAYLGRKWGDRDIAQAFRGQKGGYLLEMRPGAFKDVYEGAKGYLYALPATEFEKRPDSSGSRWEVFSTRPQKPMRVEEIADIRKALAEEGVEFIPYDPARPEFVHEIDRVVKRLDKMLPEEREGYLKWRAEVAPAEVVDALKARGVDLSPLLPTASLKDKQMDMWLKWQNTADDRYVEELLDSLQPIIKSNIAPFSNSPIPYQVLLTQANIFAREALRTYNPTKAAIGTHVANAMKQMNRFVQKHQNVKYLPEYLSSEYGRIEDAHRTLANKLRRSPTNVELADYMGLSLEQVERIQFAKSPEGLLSMSFEQDDVPLSQRVSSQQEDASAYLRASLVGKEREAYEMMMEGETSTAAIAKALKIPPEQVYAYRRRWTNMLKRSGML